MTRTPRAAVVALLALLLAGVLAGCGGQPAAAPSPSASPTPPPAAAPPPALPKVGTCYNLTYSQAIAPSASGTPVSCNAKHTAETYAVGYLKNVVDGHLVAVDSSVVARQVASACPRTVAHYIGGSTDDRRLSLLRGIGFTPTIAQSEAGANWYRCDIVSIPLSASKQLIPLNGSVKGALDDSNRAAAYRICGSTKPTDAGFAIVPCSAKHTWRALTTIDVGHGSYPGTTAVNKAGSDPCRKAATEAAHLGDKGGSVEWSWSGPSSTQWADGRTYGICWVPES